MIDAHDCAAIILAAGASKRFGANDKLLAPLDERPLVAHTLATVGAIGFGKVIVVVSDARVAAIVKAHGLEPRMMDPGQPQGASIRHGANLAGNRGAAMIFLGDMPYVAASHIEAMLAAADKGEIVATQAKDYLGPPAIVPLDLLAQVDAASDRGARSLLVNAKPIAAPELTTLDIDTTEALETASLHGRDR